MKLIVGLGNPGEKYKNNRHNVGVMVVNSLQRAAGSGKPWREEKKLKAACCMLNADMLLAKPQTFMNDSGKAVKALVKWFKIKNGDLYVVHDDLDIPLGGYKIQKGKGPELHYGVNSVEEELGTKDFWRVRIGVDNRDQHNRVSGEQYTLEDFTAQEKETIDRVVGEIIKELISEGGNMSTPQGWM